MRYYWAIIIIVALIYARYALETYWGSAGYPVPDAAYEHEHMDND